MSNHNTCPACKRPGDNTKPYKIRCQFCGASMFYTGPRWNGPTTPQSMKLTPIPGMAEDEQMRAGADGSLLAKEQREDQVLRDAMEPEKSRWSKAEKDSGVTVRSGFEL